MSRLYRSNADTIASADIVIFGVPDESGSHAKRKGTSAASRVLRAAWNEFEYFERAGKLIPICPMGGTFDKKRIFDAGDRGKKSVSNFVNQLAKERKLPVIIGGDHSVTTEAIKGVNRALGEKISLLYFDAHPDFVSSARNYYGSVLTDSSESVIFKKSALIGTRAAEPEELINAGKAGLKIITPLDLIEVGLRKTFSQIASRVRGSKTYVSIDLDCLDPAFAPGVSVPSSCGLAANDLVFLLKKVMSNLDVVGLDIVELSPDYDFNGMTASLSARILSECLASYRFVKRSRKIA